MLGSGLPTIGENIRKLREQAGFANQLDFARALEMPQSRVSELERNRYALPDTDTLIKVAKVVGRSIDEILEGVDPGYDGIVHKELWRALKTVHEIRLAVDDDYVAKFGVPESDAEREAVTAPIRKEKIQRLIAALRHTLTALGEQSIGNEPELADEGEEPNDASAREVLDLWSSVTDEKSREAVLVVLRAHAMLALRTKELRSELESRASNRRRVRGTSAKSRRRSSGR